MTISVLIVDDSEALCLYLCELLKSLGVEYADYCLDAEAALLRIEGSPHAWDAVFIDLHMEGMDGLQLMHKLDEMRFLGGIVVMSALDRKILDFTNEIISKYNLRVLGSVHKPFEEVTIAFLVKRIRNFKPGAGPEKQNLLKRKQVQMALDQNRIVPYFQPIVNPEKNKLLSLECLVRLDIDGQGTVLPSAFISVAERFNLIAPMTLSTLNCVLPQFEYFCEKTQVDCQLSVNLSPLQLNDSALPDQLYDCVLQHNVEPNKIIFEITENSPLRSEEQNRNLNRLRIKGFDLALDDFGAGFTNLGQVSSMPYTQVKLDRQMIQGISQDRVLGVIAKSVLNITQELNISLVAEGVETPADLKCLSDLGIENFQGFLFCRPKPLGELIRWWQAWKKVTKNREIS